MIEPKNTAIAELITGWKTESSQKDPSMSQLTFPYKDQKFEFMYDEKNCSRKEFQEFVIELKNEGLLECFYSKKGAILPKIKNKKASIQLKPGAILQSKSYPLPRGEVGEHLQALIRHYCNVGLFEKTNATVVNPIMAIRKPGRAFERDHKGKVIPESLQKCYRLVLSMELVNQCTVYDNIKPKDPRDVIESLKFKNCINVFDLASAFWQVELDEKVRKHFAFHIPNVGTVCSTRLVQGATNSAQTLNRILDEIFGEFFDQIDGHWFIDDASWGTETPAESKIQIKRFLKIAVENDVKLDAGKAQFMVSKANILGERVSASGLEIQRKHIDHLNDLKSPTTLKDLMSVTGVLAYHQHRSPKIALGLNMLYDALKQNRTATVFSWSAQQEKQLRELVDIVINADKKSFLLPDKGQTADDYPIIFSSDAGAGGVGISVSQIQPDNIDRWMKMGPEKGEKRVLRLLDVYARRFKEHERSWSVFRREITALAGCSLKFEYYFNQPNCMKFCRVDSRSIAFCINAANKSTVFHEFLYRLESDYRPIAIVWTEREYNTMADWLSKLGGNEYEPNRSIGWLEQIKNQGGLKVIEEDQQMDEEDEINRKLRIRKTPSKLTHRINQINIDLVKKLNKIKRKMVNMVELEGDMDENSYEYDGGDGPQQFRFDERFIKNKTRQPQRTKQETMEKFHQEFHLTKGGTMSWFKKSGFAVTEEEVEKMIKKCRKCQGIRNDRNRVKETPSTLEVTPGPFQTIAVDVISNMMKDGLKTNILVAKCLYSNYMLAKQMKDSTTMSIIRVIKGWCRDIFGVMPVFTGDNAAYFRSKEFYDFCVEHNTSVTPKPPYSPQQNEVERGVREIQERLERYESSSWSEALFRIVPNINLAPSVALGDRSPAEVVFGRTMNLYKFSGVRNSDNFAPNSIHMDYDEFRRYRQNSKTTNQTKRLVVIGSKVFCKNGIRSWGSDVHKVVRKDKKSVGVIRENDPKKVEVTRALNDIKII